jgi:hypothetical protein
LSKVIFIWLLYLTELIYISFPSFA